MRVRLGRVPSLGGGRGLLWALLTPVSLPPEPVCEDAEDDEDEEDYHNEGYL